jgi:hypothetical protein
MLTNVLVPYFLISFAIGSIRALSLSASIAHALNSFAAGHACVCSLASLIDLLKGIR